MHMRNWCLISDNGKIKMLKYIQYSDITQKSKINLIVNTISFYDIL